MEIRNPKHEIRNKFKNKKNENSKCTSGEFFVVFFPLVLSLLLSSFGFVSDFVLRISDLTPGFGRYVSW